MAAADVVDEIYDIIAGDVSPDQIYLELLSIERPTFEDVKRLCRGTKINPSDLSERALFETEDGFTLARWNDDRRHSYLLEKSDEDLTALERVQLLRYNSDQETMDERSETKVTGEMYDVAAELASVTDDEEYHRLFKE